MRKRILTVLQCLCLCISVSMVFFMMGCNIGDSGGTGSTSSTGGTGSTSSTSGTGGTGGTDNIGSTDGGGSAMAATTTSAAAGTQASGYPEPRDGGTLRLAMRTPLTLNPLLNEDATVDRILKLLFEPLTTLDEQLKPVGNLVALNFSSDYASVNLTLRSDIIWNDGTPITADDIVFSIGVLRDAPEKAIYKHQVDNIADCEKLDNRTVKITFVEIFSGSGYLFNFPIIPQHYYKNETKPASEKNMTPLGNGLFMFDTYTAMKHMTLKQSPYSHRKRAYIEQVEVLMMADAQTELHAFDQGLIDVISMEMTEWSRNHSVKQIRYGEFAAMYYDFIGFNFGLDDTNDENEAHDANANYENNANNADNANDANNTNDANNADNVDGKNVATVASIIKDKRFREAVARCIDMDALVPAIYLQHATRTWSPVNPVSWLYDTETPVYTFDPAAAKTLINQIKRTKSIPPLRILVNEENDERNKIADALVEAMTELGLDVILEQEPFDRFVKRLADGDFDIFLGGYNLSVIPDVTFAFHTDAIATGGNLLSYSDVVLDRLLRLAFSAGTEDAYLQALSQVQQRIAEELPVISLVFRQSAVLTDTRIYGDIKPTTDNIFANVNEWYIVE